MDALKFLKIHNHMYKDMHIDVENLSWMDGSDTAYLQNIVDIQDNQSDIISPPAKHLTVSDIQTNPVNNISQHNNFQTIDSYSGSVIKKE